MSTSNHHSMAISSNRKKKWANKKRKLDAFLNLAREESKVPKVEHYDNSEMANERINSIIPESLSVQRTNNTRPTFYLTEHGLNAQVNFVYYNKDKPLGKTLAPLFVLDIQQFLLKALLCGTSYDFRWGKIECVKKISHVVLFIIDGLSKDMIIHNMSQFPDTLQIFSDMVEVLTPASYQLNFASELSGVHLTLGYVPKSDEKNNDIGNSISHHPLAGVFPCPKEPVIIKDFTNVSKGFSKLHLLLNPLQLAMENFPLPDTVLEGSNTSSYCFTKNVYAYVTPNSPLFALDCEMCRMKSGKSEVIRISLVNENLDVVYSTLVKPKGHVADYLTKFSGVNKEMLLPIKITLSDVQKELQRLLPPDAILCGQSLNFDLHALRMIHPYIIDTSVIYNMSGRRTKKASLKVLSEAFLNEVIQDSEKGHDPTEDCIAAMKLVQLKLKNGPIFGDAILADCKKVKDSKNTTKISKDENCLKNGSDKANDKIYENIKSSIDSCNKKSEFSLRFFSKLKNSGKEVCIVMDEPAYKHYKNNMITPSINKKVEKSTKKVVKKSIEVMNENHLTVCHITPAFSQNINEVSTCINKFIKKLYDACEDKSLFIAVGTGTSKNDNNFENALCMIRIKKNENS